MGIRASSCKWEICTCGIGSCFGYWPYPSFLRSAPNQQPWCLLEKWWSWGVCILGETWDILPRCSQATMVMSDFWRDGMEASESSACEAMLVMLHESNCWVASMLVMITVLVLLCSFIITVLTPMLLQIQCMTSSCSFACECQGSA